MSNEKINTGEKFSEGTKMQFNVKDSISSDECIYFIKKIIELRN